MRWYFKLLIALLPFGVIFITNKCTNYPHDPVYHSSSKLNTLQRLNDQCSWACHYDTNHCKRNHVKFADSWYAYTDPIYFGVIDLMEAKDNYAFMNVLILAFLLPLTMLLLLFGIIDLHLKIKRLKK